MRPLYEYIKFLKSPNNFITIIYYDKFIRTDNFLYERKYEKKTVVLTVIAILLPVIVSCSINLRSNDNASPALTSEAHAVQSERPAVVNETQQTAEPQTEPAGTYGSAAVLQKGSYTLEEMLVYAIQDEYAAKAEYDAVIEAMGAVKPFANIVKAEESHISQLILLFEVNGLAVQQEDTEGRIAVPATFEEAKAIGIQAEIDNIAMYELFLKEELPADVKVVFQNLKTASEGASHCFPEYRNRQWIGEWSRQRQRQLKSEL